MVSVKEGCVGKDNNPAALVSVHFISEKVNDVINLHSCQLRWRDCSFCASSFISFALSESHNRCSPGIVSNSL